jgi:hypothetical protein
MLTYFVVSFLLFVGSMAWYVDNKATKGGKGAA